MTLDRDIRFSAWQITVTQQALRDEIKKRTRSIEKAEASRAAGANYQAGTLQEHYDARDAAREVLANLEVAREQIAHRVAAKLRHERNDALITKALGIGPGETLRLDVEP